MYHSLLPAPAQYPQLVRSALVLRESPSLFPVGESPAPPQENIAPATRKIAMTLQTLPTADRRDPSFEGNFTIIFIGAL